MNIAIELHDSVVGSVSHDGNRLAITLTPACLHKSDGRRGLDEGITEIQDAILSFECGHLEGEIGDLAADIMDGEFRIGSLAFPNMIALPCEIAEQSISVSLFLDPDYRSVIVSGSGLKITLLGDASHAEVWLPNKARHV